VTVEIALLLGIVACALVLFAIEVLSADVVALGVMLALVLTGLLSPERAFAGFGSDAVLLIFGLLVMTAALLRTGVVDVTGRLLVRRAGQDPKRLTVVVMVAATTLSAFISNTAATAFFLPVVMGAAARAKASPSRILMPLAFASILSSSVTLVSTSTNIVVSDLMTENGMPPMGVFELAPVGIPITIAGLAYMMVIGRRLIPERATVGDAIETFGLKAYLSEVVVLPKSRFVGKTIAESGLGRELDLTVVALLRGKERRAPHPGTRLDAGDVLLVEGSREEVLKVKDVAGIEIRPETKIAEGDLRSGDAGLVEAIVLPRSPLIGRTLKSFQFRQRFGLQVLAIDRHGETLRDKLSDVRLRMGDLLLLQGERSNIAAVEGGNAFRILGAIEGKRPNVQRALVSVLIFAGALAAGAAGLMPLALATLVGAFLVFATRCVTPEEAYRELEWKAIVLIGCMLSLGAAMDETGAAHWLASWIVTLVGDSDPIFVLGGFFVLTVALTQPMSNQAAAVVVLPVAFHTAEGMSANPRAFAMMIAVAASCSFLTPLEPSCLMVYGPGRYRFADFLRVGGLLTVIVFAIALLLVPVFWPL
jgi:di/tricarboxylate transporter